MFTCNHCPYALAWHDRIGDAAREYASRGVRFLAINPNDGDRLSARFIRGDAAACGGRRLADALSPRRRSRRWHAAFGAKTTPDLFVLDAAGVLRYRGAPDADHDDPSLRAQWLRDALDAVLAGAVPDRASTRPVGCSVKWKP